MEFNTEDWFLCQCHNLKPFLCKLTLERGFYWANNYKATSIKVVNTRDILKQI